MKLITTALLIFASLSCFAQQQPKKHLPPKIHFELTDVQLTAIQAKLDSITGMLATHSDLPSNFVSAFNNRVFMTFQPIGAQVGAQLVADTIITKPKTDKKNDH